MIATRLRIALTCLCLALLAACAAPRGGDADAGPPILVLVSIDGFRPDYFGQAPTPVLDRLRREGVSSAALIQVFPTKTFPTHYSMVTGLHPGEHGIISNTMYDEGMDAYFGLSRREAVMDPRWWGGEPIWNTAERQGLRAATFFWPGSEAPIGGRRASDWRIYDGSISYETRVDTVLEWLARPPATQPRLITLYFEGVDTAGHRAGLGSATLLEAIVEVDAALGRLVAGIERLGLEHRVNLLIVSDHGMASVAPERRIYLFDYIDAARVEVVDWGPLAAIRPDPDYLEEALHKLEGAHPNLRVFRREDSPERFHYRDHPRIAPLLALADVGWMISQRDFAPRRVELASHGWDPEAPEMHALLIGRGPAFREGLELGRIEAIHLYELMCAVLGIEPAPNSGELEAVVHLLRGH
jgi:predicted AlkP superfamily pyrophosphatase or phosphodiesterase